MHVRIELLADDFQRFLAAFSDLDDQRAKLARGVSDMRGVSLAIALVSLFVVGATIGAAMARKE